MFWGCFTYDVTGPCHIWKPETIPEKKAATVYLDALNTELEPHKKLDWELENGLRRLNLRNLGGPKPQWKFTPETGKITRGGGNGIDWYRY